MGGFVFIILLGLLIGAVVAKAMRNDD